jgi:hypothetical protein
MNLRGKIKHLTVNYYFNRIKILRMFNKTANVINSCLSIVTPVYQQIITT